MKLLIRCNAEGMPDHGFYARLATGSISTFSDSPRNAVAKLFGDAYALNWLHNVIEIDDSTKSG